VWPDDEVSWAGLGFLKATFFFFLFSFFFLSNTDQLARPMGCGELVMLKRPLLDDTDWLGFVDS